MAITSLNRWSSQVISGNHTSQSVVITGHQWHSHLLIEMRRGDGGGEGERHREHLGGHLRALCWAWAVAAVLGAALDRLRLGRRLSAHVGPRAVVGASEFLHLLLLVVLKRIVDTCVGGTALW